MPHVERSPENKVIPIHRKIHETAIVHPRAELGVGVEIGPFAIIEENVVIEDGTMVGPRVMIQAGTVVGKGNVIEAGAILGNAPQDLKYKGECTMLVIGDNNLIREYVTISRGTVQGHGETRIGNNNMFMSNVHIGHDCQIGNQVVITHGTGIAGHVSVEDGVVMGGMAGIHQFTKVGRMAMIGAHSLVTKDVPPYVVVTGNPARVYGLNIVGLRRNGLTPETRAEIKRAYNILYRSSLNVTQAVEQMEQVLPGSEEIDHFLRFLRNADRGICR